MDSSVAQEFDNQGNVTDITKQVEYSANTMDFTQDNFSSDVPLPADSFQMSGDHYQVQQSTEYHPIETVGHIQYENQGQPNLENIATEGYYSAQETQYHSSYISDQSQESETAHRNNGLSEMNTEHYIENIETQNSIPEHYGDSNTEVVLQDANIIQQPTEDNSVKAEFENTEQAEDPKAQNGGKALYNQIQESSEDSKTLVNQETVVESTKNNNVKEEVNSNEAVNTTVEETVGEQIAEEAIPMESESPEQLTELKAYEPQDGMYEVVEEVSNEDLTSGKDPDYVPGQESGELIIEDQNEEQVDNPEVPQNPEVPEKKIRRTRKPVHDLPMHLIGHNINKPVDPVQNGRTPPKPRLGVKVPYRNLTSQIVSKAELEEEVLERSRAREIAAKGNNKFARSLTQRLANRIAPEKAKKSRDKSDGVKQERNDEKEVISIEKQVEQIETEDSDNSASQGPSNSATTSDSKINNDDDLLAILEGEGEEMPVLPKEATNTEVDDTNLKLLEREIALQQLQELPLQEPTERILKPRFPKSPLLKKESPETSKSEKPEKSKSEKTEKSKSEKTEKSKSEKNSPPTSTSTSRSSQKVSSNSSPTKSNSSSKKSSEIDLDVKVPSKKHVEVEPQVKVNMVLKTYSRKRKPSEAAEFEMPSPKRPTFDDSDSEAPTVDAPKSDPLALPTDVYVTKSSRVIKKKVIWDPDDEQITRGPKTVVPKIDSNKITPVKTVKSVSIPEKKPVPSPEKKSTPVAEKKPTSSPEKKQPSNTDKLAEKSETKVVKAAEKTQEKVATAAKKVIKKSPVNKPKRGLSEVDRLLMDEGAVKMLYDLKNDESPGGKKKKDVYSVEKAEKEIIKRATRLKNDLVQNTSNESPKSLRKKEGPALISPPARPVPILERKMSKDSTKSSIHTPPRSPTLFSSQSSMLIRRRSSSSMSSEDMDEEFSPKLSKSLKKLEASKAKKQKKNQSSSEDKTDSRDASKSPAKDMVAKLVKGVQYKSFTMKRTGKHVSIDLNYIDDKCYFTIQVLEELISALKKLEKDKECNVVSLTSTSKSFCLGLDYASLVADEESERVDKATDLASCVREFLLCLLNFPKILVAGIQSECVGLGVTMLPLFDSVIASDTATFSTPYATLGCTGEAAFLLTYPNLSNNGLAAELLFANQTLKADEVCRRGLISKLCWPEKYKETLKNFLSAISKGSRQSLETSKQHLRANLMEEIEAAIDSETDILIEHWTSSECQENFSKIHD